MGAVEASSELGADASGQFGSTETFYGALGHLTLPLWRDCRRVHKRYPVDYLEDTQGLFSNTSDGNIHIVLTCIAELLILTCLICSQTNRVTEDPE